MTYDVDYFISKFEAIPARRWCVGAMDIDDKKCAVGHCGGSHTEETAALRSLLFFVMSINDGFEGPKLRGPRSRILHALREIKKEMG